jgi:Fe-S cluster assembly protein SufD
MTEVLQKDEGIIARLQRTGPATLPKEPDWLARRRRTALATLAEAGFPTTKDARWKYTDVAAVAKTPYTPVTDDAPTPAKLPALTRPVGDGARIVMINGRLHEDLSRLDALPPGLRIRALATAAPEHEATLAAVADRYADNAFTALNTVLFDDGVAIEVADGTVLDEPIEIHHVSVPGNEPLMETPRVLVTLGRTAQARLVQTFTTAGDAPHMTVPVTEIALGDGANLDHVIIQDQGHRDAVHMATLEVHQGRDATYHNLNAALGGRLARTDLTTVFTGPGGQCDLDGLFMTDGSQHVDNHTAIDHRVPHCTSRQLYKGVLDGTSRGVFHGKVDIRKDAQKSDADQHNPNLILSKGALVDSTPALEINADDVKATHGSTIGQLDRDAVFYMRSRGLPEDAARGLLVYGFAKEIVDRVRVDAVRRRLDDAILARLPQGQQVKETLHGTNA